MEIVVEELEEVSPKHPCGPEYVAFCSQVTYSHY
jgi:hypothetical protein